MSSITTLQPKQNAPTSYVRQSATTGLESSLTAAIALAALAGGRYQVIVDRLLALTQDVVGLRVPDPAVGA